MYVTEYLLIVSSKITGSKFTPDRKLKRSCDPISNVRVLRLGDIVLQAVLYYYVVQDATSSRKIHWPLWTVVSFDHRHPCLATLSLESTWMRGNP